VNIKTLPQPSDDGGQNVDGDGDVGEEVDHKAQAEKWQALSRENERKLKAALKRLDDADSAVKEAESIRAASKSEAEQIASLRAQMEQLTAASATAAAERDAAVTASARMAIGLRHGLSSDDLQFIPAGDEASMEAAAKLLATKLKVGRTPSYDGGPRGGSVSKPETLSDIVRAQLARRR
jgi:flagellar hook-length control protein FliK